MSYQLLDEFQVTDEFRKFHYVDLFKAGGIEKIMESLEKGTSQPEINENDQKSTENKGEHFVESDQPEKQGILEREEIDHKKKLKHKGKSCKTIRKNIIKKR